MFREKVKYLSNHKICDQKRMKKKCEPKNFPPLFEKMDDFEKIQNLGIMVPPLAIYKNT
jgi:hypothetical protein